MTDEPRLPGLEDLLDLVIDRVLDRIRGFEVGRVVSYDAVEQSVTVQPVVGRSRLTEAGVRKAALTSSLNHVPVWFFGNGAGRQTVPIKAGDYGMILFSSVSQGRWKRRGGLVVDPGDDRRHWESDAWFVPGGHPLSSPPTPAPTNAVVTHLGAGIELRQGSVGAAEQAMLGTTYRNAETSMFSALDALVSALSAAVAALAAASPTLTGGPTAIAAFAAAVTAVATLTTSFTSAVSAFNAGASEYLSQRVKLE